MLRKTFVLPLIVALPLTLMAPSSFGAFCGHKVPYSAYYYGSPAFYSPGFNVGYTTGCNIGYAPAVCNPGYAPAVCNPGYPVGYGAGFVPDNNTCRAFNRDGITCWQVGYVEGQTGVPWGFGGVFQCFNGCLRWIGPSE